MTTEFLSLAKALATYYGYPDLRMVVLSHPFNSLHHEEVKGIARYKAAEVIGGITEQLPPGLIAPGDGERS